jgi:hypothetical protein
VFGLLDDGLNNSGQNVAIQAFPNIHERSGAYATGAGLGVIAGVITRFFCGFGERSDG